MNNGETKPRITMTMTTTTDKQLIVQFLLGHACDKAMLQAALDRHMTISLNALLDKCENGDPFSIDLVMRLVELLNGQAGQHLQNMARGKPN